MCGNRVTATIAALHRRERHLALGCAAGLLLIALWHQTQGTTSLRNAAIVVALLYVAFWTLFRVVR